MMPPYSLQAMVKTSIILSIITLGLKCYIIHTLTAGSTRGLWEAMLELDDKSYHDGILVMVDDGFKYKS